MDAPAQACAKADGQDVQPGFDARQFVARLEQWLINTLAVFDIKGELRDGRIGSAHDLHTDARVLAATNRDLQAALPGVPDRRNHVALGGTPGDDGGASVDHAVPDMPRFVVVVAASGDEPAGKG